MFNHDLYAIAAAAKLAAESKVQIYFMHVAYTTAHRLYLVPWSSGESTAWGRRQCRQHFSAKVRDVTSPAFAANEKFSVS